MSVAPEKKVVSTKALFMTLLLGLSALVGGYLNLKVSLVHLEDLQSSVFANVVFCVIWLSYGAFFIRKYKHIEPPNGFIRNVPVNVKVLLFSIGYLITVCLQEVGTQGYLMGIYVWVFVAIQAWLVLFSIITAFVFLSQRSAQRRDISA